MRNIFHHTLSMFLHHLGKFNNSKLKLIENIEENANKKIRFLNTLSFSAHYLHTYYLL